MHGRTERCFFLRTTGRTRRGVPGMHGRQDGTVFFGEQAPTVRLWQRVPEQHCGLVLHEVFCAVRGRPRPAASGFGKGAACAWQNSRVPPSRIAMRRNPGRRLERPLPSPGGYFIPALSAGAVHPPRPDHRACHARRPRRLGQEASLRPVVRLPERGLRDRDA